MNVIMTEIPDLLILEPKVFGDSRDPSAGGIELRESMSVLDADWFFARLSGALGNG